DLVERFFAKRLGKIGAFAVRVLVTRQQLRPVMGEDREEVLTGAVLEVEHACPQSRGARGAGCFDDRLQELGPVRKSRQDGRHAHADVNAGSDELFDRTQALAWMGRAWLGLAPDLVVERGDAEGDVQLGMSSEVGQV